MPDMRSKKIVQLPTILTSLRQRNKAFLPIIKLRLDMVTLCQATDCVSDDLENKQDVINVEERSHMNSSKFGIA